jgi:hypothetical protein
MHLTQFSSPLIPATQQFAKRGSYANGAGLTQASTTQGSLEKTRVQLLELNVDLGSDRKVIIINIYC